MTLFLLLVSNKFSTDEKCTIFPKILTVKYKKTGQYKSYTCLNKEAGEFTRFLVKLFLGRILKYKVTNHVKDDKTYLVPSERIG